MVSKSVGICLVGVGRADAIHAKNYSEGIIGAMVVAAVDVVQEAAMKAAEEYGAENCYTDHKEALKQKDVDAIVTSTPTFTHAKIAIDTAEAGKHVFYEKPMALTMREAEMIAAARFVSDKMQANR